MIKLLSEVIVNKFKVAALAAKLGIRTAELKILKTVIRKKNK